MASGGNGKLEKQDQRRAPLESVSASSVNNKPSPSNPYLNLPGRKRLIGGTTNGAGIKVQPPANPSPKRSRNSLAGNSSSSVTGDDSSNTSFVTAPELSQDEEPVDLAVPETRGQLNQDQAPSSPVGIKIGSVKDSDEENSGQQGEELEDIQSAPCEPEFIDLVSDDDDDEEMEVEPMPEDVPLPPEESEDEDGFSSDPEQPEDGFSSHSDSERLYMSDKNSAKMAEPEQAEEEEEEEIDEPVPDPYPVMFHQDPRRRRIKTVTDFADVIGVNPFIEMVANRKRVNGPTRIQEALWPAIHAERSAVVISTRDSGKTLGAILPIMSRILNENEADQRSRVHKRPINRDSPRAIILCESWQAADKVKAMVDDIQERLNLLSVDRMVIKTAVIYDEEKEEGAKLINGCDLLISTYASFALLISKAIDAVSFLRTFCLVLDDLDVAVNRAKESNRMEACDAVKRFSSSNPLKEKGQVVMLASHWTIDLEQFIGATREPNPRLYSDPVLAIANFLSAALYGTVTWSLKMDLNLDKKLKELSKVIEKAKETSMRTVVFLSTDHELQMTKRFLTFFNGGKDPIPHDVVDKTTSEKQIQELKDRLLKGKDSKVLLVMPKVWKKLKLKDDCTGIVHFGFPQDRMEFFERFVLLRRHFRNVVASSKPEYLFGPIANPPSQPGFAHIFTSRWRDLTCSQLNTIHKCVNPWLLARGGSHTSQEDLESEMNRIGHSKDREKGEEVELCPEMFRGVADQSKSPVRHRAKCFLRHQILPETEDAYKMSDARIFGVIGHKCDVTFRVLQVLSPTRIVAKIVSIVNLDREKEQKYGEEDVNIEIIVLGLDPPDEEAEFKPRAKQFVAQKVFPEMDVDDENDQSLLCRATIVRQIKFKAMTLLVHGFRILEGGESSGPVLHDIPLELVGAGLAVRMPSKDIEIRIYEELNINHVVDDVPGLNQAPAVERRHKMRLASLYPPSELPLMDPTLKIDTMVYYNSNCFFVRTKSWNENFASVKAVKEGDHRKLPHRCKPNIQGCVYQVNLEGTWNRVELIYSDAIRPSVEAGGFYKSADGNNPRVDSRRLKWFNLDSGEHFDDFTTKPLFGFTNESDITNVPLGAIECQLFNIKIIEGKSNAAESWKTRFRNFCTGSERFWCLVVKKESGSNLRICTEYPEAYGSGHNGRKKHHVVLAYRGDQGRITSVNECLVLAGLAKYIDPTANPDLDAIYRSHIPGGEQFDTIKKCSKGEDVELCQDLFSEQACKGKNPLCHRVLPETEEFFRSVNSEMDFTGSSGPNSVFNSTYEGEPREFEIEEGLDQIKEDEKQLNPIETSSPSAGLDVVLAAAKADLSRLQKLSLLRKQLESSPKSAKASLSQIKVPECANVKDIVQASDECESETLTAKEAAQADLSRLQKLSSLRERLESSPKSTQSKAIESGSNARVQANEDACDKCEREILSEAEFNKGNGAKSSDRLFNIDGVIQENVLAELKNAVKPKEVEVVPRRVTFDLSQPPLPMDCPSPAVVVATEDIKPPTLVEWRNESSTKLTIKIRLSLQFDPDDRFCHLEVSPRRLRFHYVEPVLRFVEGEDEKEEVYVAHAMPDLDLFSWVDPEKTEVQIAGQTFILRLTKAMPLSWPVLAVNPDNKDSKVKYPWLRQDLNRIYKNDDSDSDESSSSSESDQNIFASLRLEASKAKYEHCGVDMDSSSASERFGSEVDDSENEEEEEKGAIEWGRNGEKRYKLLPPGIQKGVFM